MRLLGLSLILAAVLLHFSMVDWTSSDADLVGINGYGFSTTTTLVESPSGRTAYRWESSRSACAVLGLAVPVVLWGAGLSLGLGVAVKKGARQYLKATGLDKLAH